MGHTSKWQIWVQWSHFSRLLVTVDFQEFGDEDAIVDNANEVSTYENDRDSISTMSYEEIYGT